MAKPSRYRGMGMSLVISCHLSDVFSCCLRLSGHNRRTTQFNSTVTEPMSSSQTEMISMMSLLVKCRYLRIERWCQDSNLGRMDFGNEYYFQAVSLASW